MGYTTDFSGKFSLNKPAGNDLVELMSNMDHHPQGPGGYCQWILSKARTAIEWDGGEKFYDFITWIRLVAKLAGEMGYSLTGKVRWQGEERQDKGEIVAADNIITGMGAARTAAVRAFPMHPSRRSPPRSVSRSRISRRWCRAATIRRCLAMCRTPPPSCRSGFPPPHPPLAGNRRGAWTGM